MKASNIFIGNICVGDNNLIYKEGAILVQRMDGFFIDIQRLECLSDYISFFDTSSNNTALMKLYSDNGRPLFVDGKSLVPFYSDEFQDYDVSLSRLKNSTQKRK